MIDTSRRARVANWAATAVRGKTASLRYFIADRRPGSPSATVTIRVRTLAGRLVRKLVERNVAVDRRSGCDLHLPPGPRSLSLLRLRHRRRRQPAERGRQQPPARALSLSPPSAKPLSSRRLLVGQEAVCRRIAARTCSAVMCAQGNRAGRLHECGEFAGFKRCCLDQRRGSLCLAVRTVRIRRFVLEINQWRSGRPQAHFLQAPLASASDTIAATTASLT